MKRPMRWRRCHPRQLFVAAVVILSFVTVKTAFPSISTLDSVPPRQDVPTAVRDDEPSPFKGSGEHLIEAGYCAVPTFPDLVLANDKGKRQQRGTSVPLVTGDGFRVLCRDQFILDDTTTVSALADRVRLAEPKNGTVFFVQTHFVEAFLDKILPLLTHGFILITHNSDYSAPFEPGNTRLKNGIAGTYERQRRLLLDNPKLIRWYAQNPSIDHDKLFPIPIGLENRYNKYGQYPEVYAKALCKASGRSVAEGKKLLFVSFNVKTNKAERSRALSAATAFAKSRVTISQPQRTKSAGAKETLEQYLATMAQHRFALTPHGHGLDTHRLWEALYAGTVPVVQRSHMDKRLLSLLPVLLVDEYSDVSEAVLDQFIVSGAQWDTARRTALNMSWWAAQICQAA